MTSRGSDAWFEGERLEAFAAYRAVLDANLTRIYDDVGDEVLEYAPSLARMGNRETAREHANDFNQLVWRAIREGDWAGVENALEARGAAFARLGVRIEEWSDMVLLSERCAIRFVVAAHGHEPARLGAILTVMSDWSLRSIRVARAQYVRTREEIAAAQNDALRRSERLFRAVVESSAEAVSLLDRDGRVVYASASASRLAGAGDRTLVGLSVFDLVSPASLGFFKQRWQECLHRPGVRLHFQLELRPVDGSARYMEMIQTNHLDDPNLGAVVTMVRDVTGTHRLEEQLRQSQKLEAVGRLAGGVAHDFNNLLSAIIGYCDLIEPSLTGDPAADDLMQIRRAGESAASLTRQLLAFSRKQVLSPQVLSLSATVASMNRMMRRLVGDHIELVMLPDETVGNVCADPHQVEQVVMNLVVNARDAMPGGGKLVVETADVELDAGHAEVLGVSPGPYVRLAVSDSGEGMKPEVLSHIFEPFFTTKGEGGTGLGLATVFGIVRQSGGAISVYSELGSGTTFRVYFPRTNDCVPAAVAEPAPATPGGRETILLVDDSEQVRTLAHEVLRRQGYRVIVASNPGEALLAAEQHAGEIGLLLTDIVMPKMTGAELAERLLKLRPTLRVLYMSGYTENTVIHGGTLDPGVAFLAKPITPAALLRKVRETMGRA